MNVQLFDDFKNAVGDVNHMILTMNSMIGDGERFCDIYDVQCMFLERMNKLSKLVGKMKKSNETEISKYSNVLRERRERTYGWNLPTASPSPEPALVQAHRPATRYMASSVPIPTSIPVRGNPAPTIQYKCVALSMSEVKELPKQCTICFETPKKLDSIRTTCFHDFCKGCFRDYVLACSSSSDSICCPNCRADCTMVFEHRKRASNKKTSSALEQSVYMMECV
jgi:hypothetical protein